MSTRPWRNLVEVDLTDGPSLAADATTFRAWMNDRVIVTAHDEGWAIRLSVLTLSTTAVESSGLSLSEQFSFEELDSIKNEAGYGDRCAVEIFPAADDVVPGPAARHLWVLPPGVKTGWVRERTPAERQELAACEASTRLRASEAVQYDRREVVREFVAECAWVRSVRDDFAEMFEEPSEIRLRLLEEIAESFFKKMNGILQEFLLLQQCKLTDPARSGADKRNLTTQYLLTLEWSPKTRARLLEANRDIEAFRTKIEKVRSKLIAHADLASRMGSGFLGAFAPDDEKKFWSGLQLFVNAIHEETFGEPFSLQQPSFDSFELIHALIEAVDYDDMVKADASFLTARQGRRRYDDAL